MNDITALAQSHELLIANGNETARLLRHLANNEIDSDYFAVVSECESYGQETEAELSITDFALRAAGYVDALVEALEKAQQESTAGAAGMAESYETTISMLKGRIAELEESRNKLREGMAAIYNAICADGASTSLSAILTFVKRAHEESATAGIQVIEGDER